MSLKFDRNLPLTSPVWGCQPLIERKKLCGQNIDLSYYRHPAYQLAHCCSSQHLLKIFLDDGIIERSLGELTQPETVRQGDVVLIPAHFNHSAGWTTEIEFLLIAIEPEAINTTAESTVSNPSIELLPYFARTDALLYGIGLALLRECQQWHRYSVYSELLLQTLKTHLLKKYAPQAEAVGEKIDYSTEDRLERTIKYIHDNLDRHLSLNEIARQANMSKHYFCNLFGRFYGISPYRYILQKRIERAKLLIQNYPELKMIDIAYDCGFGSQSHFNHQFRSITGMTPGAYRRRTYSLL